MAQHQAISDPTKNGVCMTTAVLLLMIFVFLPVLSYIDISQIVSIPVTLGLYGAFVLAYGQIVDGTISFAYVSTTLAFSIPVLQESTSGVGTTETIGLFISVPAFGVLLIMLNYSYVRDNYSLRFTFLEMTAITAATGFVLWSVFAAWFGDTNWQFAATAYAFENIFLIVGFITTIFVVQHHDFRFVMIPLFFSIVANIIYSAGQSLTGETLDISYLGEGTRIWEWDSVYVSSIEITRGLGGGFTGNPRELLPLSLLITPLVIYFIMSGSGWARALSILVLLAAIIVNIASNSENGVAALGIVTILFIMMIITRKFEIRQLYGWSARYSLTALAGTVIFITMFSIRPTKLIKRRGMINELAGSNLDSRVERNHVGIETTLDSLLFGIGGKNFNPISNQLLGETSFIHNIFFANLTFTGVPGFLLYLTFVFVMLYVGVQKSQQLAGKQSGVVWTCMLIGVVGLLWYAQWEVVHYYMQARFALWVVAGVIVGTRVN